MAGVVGREKRKTFRCGDEEEQILEKNAKKYNISESECIRLAILNLEQKEKIDALQQLCNMCSVLNKTMEKYEFKEEDKEILNKEMKAVWQELR